MNEHDLGGGAVTYSFGSWCGLDDGMLNHVTFLPNFVYAPGLLNALVKAEYERSRWLAQLPGD